MQFFYGFNNFVILHYSCFVYILKDSQLLLEQKALFFFMYFFNNDLFKIIPASSLQIFIF